MFAPLNRFDWRDFLARPPLSPSSEILSACADTSLLITGAGGSIGSALALRLAQSRASRLVLLDASESHLCQLQQAMEQAQANPDAVFVLGDAGDVAVLDDIFLAHRPRIVFHAAAFKHVPFLERQPFAAIANNVFATRRMVSAAARHKARVVLLSTDKAVQPTSVMGATKRIAEKMVLASGGTALRLGNVLASSGSVTEIFARQAMQGGPLTVTDPAARRYLLTMDEAVNLLLAAAYIAANDESAKVLAPALAADHSIAGLARFMARSLAPDRELALHFTGLRPGDKLAERLWDTSEYASPAAGGLLSIHAADLESAPESAPESGSLASGLAALEDALSERNLAAALSQLRHLVPDFCPSATVLALAQQMPQRVSA